MRSAFQALRRLGARSHHIVRQFQSEAEAARDLSAQAAREQKRQAGVLEVFDTQLKARHRDRAAWVGRRDDPLLVAVTDRLLDRLEDCLKKFPRTIVLGGAAQQVVDRIAGGRAGIEHVTYVDTSRDMLDKMKACEAASRTDPSSKPWPAMEYVHMDPAQEVLHVQPESYDLVISSLGLHWTNDLPGVMTQSRLALRPDGLFLGSLFGGESLQELRIACAVAQLERQGGVSAMVSPLAQVRDSGNLLTRAGLALPAVDVDEFQLMYPSPAHLVDHLRAMGESNAVLHRQAGLSRDVALAASAVYQSMFQNEDGFVPATFQVMYLTGWAPHESQQKPAKRGSATVSFQELANGLANLGATAGATGEGGEDGGACSTK